MLRLFARFVRVWAAVLVAVVAVAATVALPAPVFAKPKPPATPQQRQAATHVTAAENALKSGDAATAITELKAANELASNADILLSLSRAQALSGDVVEARNTLRTLLATYERTLGTRRPAIEAELAKAQGNIATLKLDVPEAGAGIALDDRDLGTSPLTTPIEQRPGSHKLVVAKPGFVTVTRQLDMTAGTTALTIELAPQKATGRLLVTSSAEDTFDLLVNDQRMGKLPAEVELAPGFYKIQAIGKKMLADAQSVHVELGQTTSVALSAKVIPGEANISAGDPSAVIFVDDRQVGAGEWHGSLPAGQHSLRVERSGFAVHRQALDVAPGERVVVGSIVWVPAGAKAPDDTTSYEGIFANVALIGLFSPGATNSIARDCAANSTGGDCSSMHPTGGGLGFRMGYSFGWVALEGLLLGSADAATATANYEYGTSADLGPYYGVPRTEEYGFVRYGFGLGIGARVMSRHPFIRFTGGLDGTLMRQSARYARVTTANTTIPDAEQHNSPVESYIAPGLMADLGVLLGSTPGAKFHTGIAVVVMFPPDPVTVDGAKSTLGHYTPSGPAEPYGTPAIDVTRGPQVAIGPFLAMQFGH